MSPIEKLSEHFSRFPGIGTRQARRFVYFLLSSNEDFIRELVELIESLRKDFAQCELCFRFLNGKAKLCAICINTERDRKTLMVVEKDIDLENVEKSGTYKGRYFVLGGILPLLSGKKDSAPRLKDCAVAVSKQAHTGELKEVILALSAHPEGEHTMLELQKILKPITEKNSLKVTTLGRGLSTGTELEYSDGETIRNALQNRR